jgi:hypothetical protein
VYAWPPDTTANRWCRAVSLLCALFQVLSVPRHIVTYYSGMGTNPLVGLEEFVGFMATVAISLPLLVVSSGIGLGAGKSQVLCISCNIVGMLLSLLFTLIA